jgi:membrane-bound ClpP family serine protease
MLIDLGQSRFLLVEQGTNSVSVPLLAVVVFSFAISFMSFSLNADPNPTVVITFLLGALSIAGVIFLILEMYTPFRGLIQISSAPMRNALAHLGR